MTRFAVFLAAAGWTPTPTDVPLFRPLDAQYNLAACQAYVRTLRLMGGPGMVKTNEREPGLALRCLAIEVGK